MESRKKTQQGVAYGIAAYGLWGLIPLYFKSVAQVASTEVLAHRAVWSCVCLIAVTGLLGRWSEVRQCIENRPTLRILALNSFIIAVNWLIFIYAVATRQVVQSSLGYFIAPLINVLFGVVLLRERLRPYQLASLALAALGMFVLATLVGEFPWIAIALAVSMASYGFIRKIAPVGSLMATTIETLVMTPVALAYIGYLNATGEVTCHGLSMLGLLMLAGPVTTIPLLMFGIAARRLRLSTIGFLQYLTPSLQFLLAVFAFAEPFSQVQVIGFGCIWAAVSIYTFDSLASVAPA